MPRYIDADILKNKTTRVNHIWNGITNAEGKGLDEIIDDIPTADVRENVIGEWIENKKTKQDYQLLFYKVLTCSQCGNQQIKLKGSNFCPNCGADMKGGKHG